MSIFVQQPWFGASLALPQVPIGMLGEREAALFYHLARDWYSGRGAILDVGSFLGKSAFFFAQGLRANRGFDATRHRVHCFDNFLVNEARTVDFLQQHFGRQSRLYDSTRDLFERQVAPVRRLLEVHEGDFAQLVWSPRPVEILMVDIAKTESLGAKVVAAFFGDLMPRQSVVVHQDYHHPWLPHIHVAMEYLHDCFELVAPRVDASAAFLLVRAIPGELLERASHHAFSSAEQLALMDRAVERFAPADRWQVELARLVLRSRFVAVDEVRRELESLQVRAAAAGALGDGELAEVLAHVELSEAWRCFARGEHAQVLPWCEALVARGRIDPSLRHVHAAALAELGRWSEAERVARQALVEQQSDDGSRLVLARALAARGQFDAAEAEVLAGLAPADRQPDLLRHCYDLLASIWQTRGDFDAVLQRLPSLRAQFGHHGELWRLDAYVHTHCGDRAAGLSSWRRANALGLEPGRGEELVRLLRITDDERAQG